MNVIYQHNSEKRVRNMQFVKYLPHGGAGGILAGLLFKTTDLKYPD